MFISVLCVSLWLSVYNVSQSLNILLTVCIHEKMVSFCFYSVSNGQQSRIGTKSSGGHVNARPNTTESCCHCSFTESTVAPPRPHNLVWQNRNHQGLQIFEHYMKLANWIYKDSPVHGLLRSNCKCTILIRLYAVNELFLIRDPTVNGIFFIKDSAINSAFSHPEF